MRALFRYSLMKTRRDGSIWVFLSIAPFLALSVLVGDTVSHGLADFHYPFIMQRGWSGARTAQELMAIETIICAMLGTLLSFGVLRHEIATRSINSIALALRPAIIAASLVIFAAFAAVVSWLLSLLLVAILTAALPLGLGMLIVKIVIGALVTASVGALCVTISPEPPMIIGAYVATLFFVPGFERSKVTPMLLAPVAAAIVVTAVAAFLLERRCAR